MVLVLRVPRGTSPVYRWLMHRRLTRLNLSDPSRHATRQALLVEHTSTWSSNHTLLQSHCTASHTIPREGKREHQYLREPCILLSLTLVVCRATPFTVLDERFDCIAVHFAFL